MTGLVSPQFHDVVDDDFSMVLSLRAGTVPNNLQQLLNNSRKKSTTGFYDLTKTWFEANSDPSAPTDNNKSEADPDSSVCTDNNRLKADPDMYAHTKKC